MDLLIIDLDGTLTKSDNLVRFSVFMLFRKNKLRFFLFFLLYIALKIKLIDNIIFKIWYSYLLLKNQNINELDKCAEEFVSSESFKRDINQDVLRFIDEYTEYKKIVISANYSFLAEKIAVYLGIETCLSINLEVLNSQYIGQILGRIPYGAAKVEVYKDFVKNSQNNKSVGIGDSKSDLPILKYLDAGYLVKYDKKLKKTTFDLV